MSRRWDTHASASILFTPDGRTLVSVGEDNTIRTWECEKTQRQFNTTHVHRTNNRSWNVDPHGGTTNQRGGPDARRRHLIGVEESFDSSSVVRGRRPAAANIPTDRAADLNIRHQVMHVRVCPTENPGCCGLANDPEYERRKVQLFHSGTCPRADCYVGEPSRHGSIGAVSPRCRPTGGTRKIPARFSTRVPVKHTDGWNGSV